MLFIYCTCDISAPSGKSLEIASYRYFITGRGCGISTKIKYLNYFPEQLDNHECSFIDSKVVSNHPTIELKG